MEDDKLNDLMKELLDSSSCVHIKQHDSYPKVANDAGNAFYLCPECSEVYNNDPHDDPKESRAYHIYHTNDPKIPADKWTRLNPKPLTVRPANEELISPGRHFYRIRTVNALGRSLPDKHSTLLIEDGVVKVIWIGDYLKSAGEKKLEQQFFNFFDSRPKAKALFLKVSGWLEKKWG